MSKSTIVFSDPIDCPTVVTMEFRLVYGGEDLKPASHRRNRVREKHEVRRYLHPQLQQLWATDPLLRFYNLPHHLEPGYIGRVIDHETTITKLAGQYEGFVPLVNDFLGTTCDLDILYLRPQKPGGIIQSGTGDIDNHLKTLFDALAIPPRGQVPTREEGGEPDPSPFFVLLSDDSLITSVKAATDRLLAPPEADPIVIVHVTVKTPDPVSAPFGISL